MAQPSSSEPSRQSGSPSQRRARATHCPLWQGNSDGLHFFGTVGRGRDDRGHSCPHLPLVTIPLVHPYAAHTLLRKPHHPSHPSGLTASLLVSVIQAVSMAIAQPALRDAAGGTIAAQGTVLCGAPAAHLIRGIGTLRHPITALVGPNTRSAASTVEGPWGENSLLQSWIFSGYHPIRHAGKQPETLAHNHALKGCLLPGASQS